MKSVSLAQSTSNAAHETVQHNLNCNNDKDVKEEAVDCNLDLPQRNSEHQLGKAQ